MSVESGRVVIVGAGVSGLVTARILRDDGFDVTVIEKEPTIGGVWAQSRAYPGLRTNNSQQTYVYTDHPYDPSADEFPTAEQVRDYLGSYVARFELGDLLRLSTEVLRVERNGTGFEVEARGPAGTSRLDCDYVVVCAGTYSVPVMPEFEGAESFTGAVMHSSTVTDPALLEDKRVVVLGAGKSALDAATWAAKYGRRSTLVFRRPHWMVPRYLPGGIPADHFTLGRVSEMFVPYYRLNRVERFLHGPGAVLPWLFWRFIGRLFRTLLRMPAEMVPDEPFDRGRDNLGFISEFYSLARAGRVDMLRDGIVALDGDEVVLASGKRVAADIVVCATGFRQDLRFLAPELRDAVAPDGRFALYRHILSPTEPRLACIGFASSTACMLTAEMSAHWLAQVFAGKLVLPTTAEMTAEIRQAQDWLAAEFPARPQGYYIGQHLTRHIDALLSDMGLPTRRTRNIFTEYFGSFGPARYRDVAAQRRAAKAVVQSVLS